MRTIIAQHDGFTMKSLYDTSEALLMDAELTVSSPERMGEIIRAAIDMGLPDGYSWDSDTGEIFTEDDHGHLIDLESFAWLILAAVTSESWTRARSAPEGARIVFGWNPLQVTE